MLHRLATTLIALTLLSACQPADVSPKTVKERLDGGELVEFSKPGFRPKACSDRQSDWSDIRLSNNLERQKIVLGQQLSVLNPGIYSCFRVGSIVALNVQGLRPPAGQVRITKLAWVKLDSLEGRHLKGQVFARSQDVDRYRDQVRLRMQADHAGMVTVVEFTYLKGTAADEKAIKEDEDKRNQGDGLEETTADGQALSSCKNAWSDVFVPTGFHGAIQEGKISSWYQLGERNCLKQGQTVALRASRDQAPFTTASIKKIKRFKTSFLDAKYFVLNEYDFANLKTEIENANRQKNEIWMTVVDFELNSTQEFQKILQGVRP